MKNKEIKRHVAQRYIFKNLFSFFFFLQISDYFSVIAPIVNTQLTGYQTN